MSYRKLKINYSEFHIEVIKIAKRLDVNVNRCTERQIEIIEPSRKKEKAFREEVYKLNEDVRINELIKNNQYTDTRGNDVLGSKALYQVDDDYYEWLISNGESAELKKAEEVDEEIIKGQIGFF